MGLEPLATHTARVLDPQIGDLHELGGGIENPKYQIVHGYPQGGIQGAMHHRARARAARARPARCVRARVDLRVVAVPRAGGPGRIAAQIATVLQVGSRLSPLRPHTPFLLLPVPPTCWNAGKEQGSQSVPIVCSGVYCDEMGKSGVVKGHTRQNT